MTQTEGEGEQTTDRMGFNPLDRGNSNQISFKEEALAL